MNIEPASRLSPVSPAPRPDHPLQWQVGAVHAIRVLGREPGGRFRLLVEEHEIDAEAAPGVLLPDRFTARVARGGAQPQLDVVLGEDTLDSDLARALLARIPRQSGLPALLADLHQLLLAPSAVQEPTLVDALSSLARMIADASAFASSDTTEAHLRNSGLFLEARLIADGEPETLVRRDWKAGLLRLAAAIEPLAGAASPMSVDALPPPQPARPLPRQPRARRGAPGWHGDTAEWARLRQLLNGSIARIEIAQLQAIGPSPTWLFEIPLRGRGGFDVLQLRICAAANGGAQPAWQVEIAIDLPALGPIGADLSVRGERVTVQLWADVAAVARRMEATLAGLATQLQNSGLIVEHIACRYGAPEPPSDRPGGIFSTTA